MIKLGWLKRRIKETDRSWWYVGYAYNGQGRMICSGMIYTLSTTDFILPSIQRDLERRHGCDVVTILSWQSLTQKEGANLAAYFDARMKEIAARAGLPEPSKPRLSLVRLDKTSEE